MARRSLSLTLARTISDASLRRFAFASLTASRRAPQRSLANIMLPRRLRFCHGSRFFWRRLFYFPLFLWPLRTTISSLWRHGRGARRVQRDGDAHFLNCTARATGFASLWFALPPPVAPLIGTNIAFYAPFAASRHAYAHAAHQTRCGKRSPAGGWTRRWFFPVNITRRRHNWFKQRATGSLCVLYHGATRFPLAARHVYLTF